jgi:hypothetical protein
LEQREDDLEVSAVESVAGAIENCVQGSPPYRLGQTPKAACN